jgi:glucose-6-phosphate 1-dehydrogenase
LHYPNGEQGEIKWAKYIPTLLFFFGAHEDLAYKQIFPALLGWPKASKWIQLEKMRVVATSICHGNSNVKMSG